MLNGDIFTGGLGDTARDEILSWTGPDPDEPGPGMFEKATTFLTAAQEQQARVEAKKKSQRNTLLMIGGVAAAGLLIYFVSRR